MDIPTLAIAAKKAAEVAKQTAETVAASVAERVARSIVPEKGDNGYTPVKGVDYFDGYTPVKGEDYFDGEPGYSPVKGKDYDDGRNGKDANRWHLTDDVPDDDFGDDDDFALTRKSEVYHKVDGEWQFVVYLKAEVGMQMMPPAQPSEVRIEEIITRLLNKPDIHYTAVDYTINTSNDVILADGTVTITLPLAAGNAGCTFRIKNIGTGDVTVKGQGTDLIDGEDCQIMTVQYYAIDVVSDGGGWVIV